jgi:hypothetical protein
MAYDEKSSANCEATASTVAIAINDQIFVDLL